MHCRLGRSVEYGRGSSSRTRGRIGHGTEVENIGWILGSLKSFHQFDERLSNSRVRNKKGIVISTICDPSWHSAINLDTPVVYELLISRLNEESILKLISL